jgi:uncharacterized protein
MTKNSPREPKLYPCLFPIKIIGINSPRLEEAVVQVMNALIENLNKTDMKRRESAQGKYSSITLSIVAQSREQIELIYKELNARDEIIMVL